MQRGGRAADRDDRHGKAGRAQPFGRGGDAGPLRLGDRRHVVRSCGRHSCGRNGSARRQAAPERRGDFEQRAIVGRHAAARLADIDLDQGLGRAGMRGDGAGRSTSSVMTFTSAPAAFSAAT